MSSETQRPMDGLGIAKLSTKTFEMSIIPSGRDAWISFQRGSLVRIFQRLAKAKDSRERGAASSGPRWKQLTFCDLDSSSSKTCPQSKKEAGEKLSALSWREDIPGEMEPLRRLMSGQDTSGTAGGASSLTRKAKRFLPTLRTADAKHGPWLNRPHGGDDLVTTLSLLPQDIASFTNGCQLTPTFAEWWMGFPIGFTQVKAKG